MENERKQTKQQQPVRDRLLIFLGGYSYFSSSALHFRSRVMTGSPWGQALSHRPQAMQSLARPRPAVTMLYSRMVRNSGLPFRRLMTWKISHFAVLFLFRFF